MQPKILLATTVRWLAGARLAAGFAKIGCEVDAFAPDGAAMRLSRYLCAQYRYDVFAPRSSLSTAIAKSKPDLIVPCDDRALSQLLSLAELDSAIRPLIAHSLGKLESYPKLISRSGFIAAARDLGIRAAESVSIESQQDLSAALARFGLPAVLKTDGSWGGDGVALVRTQQEAFDLFRRSSRPPSRLRGFARAIKRRDAHFAMNVLKPQKSSLSVQRFIAGTPANSAFACWQGRVLAAFHVDVIQSQEGNGPACVVRRIEDEDMQRAAERIAARFELSGLHGIDFMRDASRRAHVIESNPRATQTSMLVVGGGRDLLAALIEAATQSRPSQRPAVTERETVALFPQEWTRDPASRWLSEAYHDVPWDDPAVLRAGLAAQPRPAVSLAHALGARLRQGHAFTTWKPSRPSF